MKTILTAGVFDLLHFGHVELFRRAKALGDRLVVAVQEDRSILKYKPEAKTVYSTEERRYLVAAIRYVDEAITYDDVDRLVQETGFDVFVMGGDQTHAGFQRAETWCREHGKETVRLARTEGISTSALKQSLKD